MANKVLEYIVVIFLLFSVFQSIYLFDKVNEVQEPLYYETTGAAASYIAICINTPPSLTVGCNSTTDQGDFYECQLNATDAEGDNLTYSNSFTTNITVFTVNSTGYLSFTSNNSHVGNHTALFTIEDSSACLNNQTNVSFEFEVINGNDAPFLSQAIPNVTYSEDEIVNAFFLNNHFTDPDGDNLTYNVSVSSSVNVTILNTSEVIINSTSCDFQVVAIFTAQDPFNLTAQSNSVIIICNADEGESTGSSNAASGGGGGGGGSALLCRSNFECFEHRVCNINNTKVMRCVDLNGCEDEEYLNVECNYEQEQKLICEEDWLCGEWGPCTTNSTQHRECIDTNRCDTKFDAPATIKACVYTPTCSDGVKNGNETGVDCGGECAACRTIETPSPIQEKAGILTQLIILIIILMLLGTLAYKYAHKEIYVLLANLGLHFAGRVPKQILLDENSTRELMRAIKEFQSGIAYQNTIDLTKEFVKVCKSYFFHALDLTLDSDKEDLLAKFEDRKLNEYLKRVLASFFDKMLNTEFSPQPSARYELMFLAEELKEVIIQTAEIPPELLEAKVTEYRIPDNFYPKEKVELRLINAYIALHFNQIDVAIAKYKDLLDFYEHLPVTDQDSVYYDIARLYQKIRYRSAWIENME